MPAPASIRLVRPGIWELAAGFRPGMRVPVRVFASEKLLAEMDATVFEQAANVATLPGIVGASLCMPDAHWGYGFPIGGVAAMDVRERRHLARRHRLRHQLRHAAGAHRPDLCRGAAAKLRELVDALADRVPAGVGRPASCDIDRRRVPRGALQGRSLGRREGLRDARGPRAHRGGRLLRRGRSRAASASGRSSAATARSARWAPATTTSRSRSLHPEGVFDADAGDAPSASICPSRW